MYTWTNQPTSQRPKWPPLSTIISGWKKMKWNENTASSNTIPYYTILRERERKKKSKSKISLMIIITIINVRFTFRKKNENWKWTKRITNNEKSLRKRWEEHSYIHSFIDKHTHIYNKYQVFIWYEWWWWWYLEKTKKRPKR